MTYKFCGRRAGKKLMPGIFFLVVILILLVVLSGDSSAQQKHTGPSGRIKVVVTDMENDAGQIRIALFNSEETYVSRKNPFRTASVKIKNKRSECVFEGLPYGTYAIRLYHDMNENGILDKDPGGIPLEPYAFSNNAKGMMGPAPWAKARFSIQSKYREMEISLD